MKSLRDMTEADFDEAQQPPAAQPNVETHGPDAETWAERGKPPAAQPVGFYRDDDSFGEFTIPCSGAVSEHGWRPVYLQPDPRIAQLEADLAAAQAEVERAKVELEHDHEICDRLERERDSARAEAAALREQLQRLARMSPNNAKYLGIRIDAAIDEARGGGNG